MVAILTHRRAWLFDLQLGPPRTRLASWPCKPREPHPTHQLGQTDIAPFNWAGPPAGLEASTASRKALGAPGAKDARALGPRNRLGADTQQPCKCPRQVLRMLVQETERSKLRSLPSYSGKVNNLCDPLWQYHQQQHRHYGPCRR